MLLGFDFRPKSLGSMFCCGICKKNLASKISTSTWLSGRPGHHFYGSCDLNFARLHSHKSDGLGGEFHPTKAPPILPFPPKPPSTNHPNHQIYLKPPLQSLQKVTIPNKPQYWPEPFPKVQLDTYPLMAKSLNDFATWDLRWHITTEEEQGDPIQALVKQWWLKKSLTVFDHQNCCLRQL